MSHSSIESSVISLEAGSGMDGIVSFGFMDLVIEVLQSSEIQTLRNRSREQINNEESGHRLRNHTNANTLSKIHSNWEVDEFFKVDHVVTSVKPSYFVAQPYILKTWQKSDDETGVSEPTETR